MSRGHGKVERLILGMLQGLWRTVWARDVAQALAGKGEVTRAALEAARRALRNLERQGLIRQEPGHVRKLWVLAGELEKQKREENRRWRDRSKAAKEKLGDFSGNFFAEALRQKRTIHISPSDRETVVKILGMMGSAHDGEALAAVRKVEAIRTKYGVTWDQLVRDAGASGD